MTSADRISIQALLQVKLNGAAIAQKHGFSRSAINRERCCGSDEPAALAVDDNARAAQVRLQPRRCDAGAFRWMLGPNTQSPLRCTVVERLRCHRPQQQIAGKLPGMNKSASLAAQRLLPAAPPARRMHGACDA